MKFYLKEEQHPFDSSRTIVRKYANPDGSHSTGSCTDMKNAVAEMLLEGFDFEILENDFIKIVRG